MLIKIGTLGKMAAEFAGVEKKGDFLVASLQVKEGMQWEVISAVSYKEALQIAKAALKPKIIWFLLTGWAGKPNPKPPKL
ncbi:MAG: hypothetical protein ABIK12_16095 [Pseudomonadota bacterium]|nr:hypothetical protein [Pseudomonadota bacterium]MBU4574440.1 hypothetical protein [Pseudomonadota bacterium]MBU4597205.1 hypothetical protein [Pseudomonadota bacterium]